MTFVHFPGRGGNYNIYETFSEEFLKTTPPSQYDHATAIEVRDGTMMIVSVMVMMSMIFDFHAPP